MAKALMNEHEVTFKERDLGSVLDMMRYEQDTVVTWTHHYDPERGPGYMTDRYTVTLRCEATAYQPDRWSSFLLRSTLKSQY